MSSTRMTRQASRGFLLAREPRSRHVHELQELYAQFEPIRALSLVPPSLDSSGRCIFETVTEGARRPTETGVALLSVRAASHPQPCSTEGVRAASRTGRRRTARRCTAATRKPSGKGHVVVLAARGLESPVVRENLRAAAVPRPLREARDRRVRRHVTRLAHATTIAVLGFAVIGCGSGPARDTGSATTTTRAKANSAKTARSDRSTKSKRPPKTATTPTVPRKGSKLIATLTAPTHKPTAGEPWPYAIRVTNSAGKAVSGTATVTVETATGQVVDGVGTFDAKRPVRGTYRWPTVDRGKSLFFQVRIEAVEGSDILRYPVRVQ